jgi:branched-chain amino acid transport system substrate-binding protein
MKLGRRMFAVLLAGLSVQPMMAWAQQKEPLRIGAMVALSGPAAVFGGPAEKALRVLVDNLGSQGIGGHPVQLTVYDTEGNTTKAVQLFRRLVENDNVHVVMGPSTSGESLAVVPLTNQMEVPNITFGGAEPITKPTTPYVFATSPTDRMVVENLLTEFRDKKLTKVALIYSVDAFGQSGGSIAKELASQYGVNIVAEETFGPQDVNMAPQLLRIRNAQAQAMLIWSANPGPSIVMRNAAELGVTIPLYASYASGSRQFLSQTGPAAEGSFVPSYRIVSPETLPDIDALKQPLIKFAKLYKDRWSIEPDQTSGHSYDVVLMLQEAVKSIKGPLTRKALRDALENVKINGANGIRQLSAQDHRGLDKTTVVMMQAKGGRWYAVQK